jgi:hypothetical protein
MDFRIVQSRLLPILERVPLSEREQRILEEIEKNLYQEDPSFARDVRRRSPRMDEVRRARLGVFIFLCGFALLIGFFVSRSVLVGVVAFGAMVGGIVLVAGAIKGLASGRGMPSGIRRDRLTTMIHAWEQRLRRRYRRR